MSATLPLNQASQLVIDITPDQLLREEFPASWAWVKAMEDLSGVEGDNSEEGDNTGVEGMLVFAAQVYFPFLAANRAALAAGEKEVIVFSNVLNFSKKNKF